MNCRQASAHLFERMEHALDQATSAALRDHLAGCEACRREAEELGEVWSMLGNLDEARAGAEVRARFYSMLHKAPTRHSLADWLQGWWPRQLVYKVGLALGMLMVGLWLGPQLIGPDRAEIDELRVEVQSMSRVLTLSLLEHQSASERLRAVGLSRRSEADAQLTRALLDVLARDSSVNVRLAALDVLSLMVERPEVRSGLLEAFPRQKSPIMQVTLAEILMTMNGPRYEEALRRMLEGDQVLDAVREYLEKKLSEKGDQT
jgi:hypothetical protein